MAPLESLRFGTREHGWSTLGVVRFHAIEELAAPFQYSIVLFRQATLGGILLSELVNSPASFAVLTLNRWRVVHGIVAEAEEIDRTEAVILYKVLLVPHFVRARFRRRCRNFVGKTLKQIVTAVLRNAPPGKDFGDGGLTEINAPVPPFDAPDFALFVDPKPQFRWLVFDQSRIDDASLRSYSVQYNESDFDFVSRLLEEEGISYYFEHGPDQVRLTLTDDPGQLPQHPEDATLPFKGTILGDTGAAESIRVFQYGHRMRSQKVTMRDFDWLRSNVVLERVAINNSPDAGETPYFEYPARDDTMVDGDPCGNPARVRLQRFDVERFRNSGAGSVRRMEPGRTFVLADPVGIQPELEYRILRVEACGALHEFPGTALDREPFGFGAPIPAGGYQNEFWTLTKELQFRPALVTPKPTIDGVQSAIVTAEEFLDPPEINVDPHARVRVRFPWDEKPSDGTPTSDFLRVSQYWAGGAFGALHTPRVGDEVLVAYLQGDPERPIIVGRVYNAQRVPPINPAAHPTQSTVKSQSSPKAVGHNEIRFEDLAGKEEVFLHAQRNLTEVVVASHSTSVGGDQSISVGHNQSTTVEKDQNILVHGARTTRVTHDDGLSVGGDRSLHAANCYNTANAQYSVLASSIYLGDDALGGISCDTAKVQCTHFKLSASTVEIEATESFKITVGKATTLEITPNRILLDNGSGAWLLLVGGKLLSDTDAQTWLSSFGDAKLSADGSVTLDGDTVELEGGTSIDGTAPAINWNK